MSLPDSERLRLHHGPYASPICKVGDVLMCAIRGSIRVRKFSDGPIPWPRGEANGSPFILCGDLELALRHESELAVAHHFGLSRRSVNNFRGALDVPRMNEGTTALYRANMPLSLPPERGEKGWAAAKEQLAAACRLPKSEQWKEAQSRAKRKS